MPVYAFFDFDGTLISKDSFVFILKKALKQQPWRILFIFPFLPVLLWTFFTKRNKTLSKSILLWCITIFKGRKGSLVFFQKRMSEMAEKFWFSQALEHFNKLKDQNIEIVIVSASGQFWIRHLMRKKYSNCRLIIGSRIGYFLGGLVLKSNNCYEEEKIKRIHSILGEDIIWHSAYSDHIADLPMLKKSKFRYVISPKKKHIKIFDRELEKNYTLLQWTASSIESSILQKVIENKKDVFFETRSLAVQKLPQNILMVKPTFFNIDNPINAHMLDSDGKLHSLDKEKALRQWHELKDVYLKLKFNVSVIEGHEGLPDMVFCANQSFPFLDENLKLNAVLSNMVNDIRQNEVDFIRAFLYSKNYSTQALEMPSTNNFFEGMGDALWLGNKKLILGGYGFRSDKIIYHKLSKITNCPIAIFELKNPKFYHLDTCLSILNSTTALVCKEAFTNEGYELLQSLIPNLLEVPLSEADAPGFACNAHCPDEKHVIIQTGNTTTLALLQKFNFIPIEVDTSEYIKSGGSVFCMKLMFF